MNIFALLAFLAGTTIAVQMAMNAQLGSVLKSPMLASVCAFFSAVVVTALAVVFTVRDYPSINTVKTVPVYLWFTGGLLSALAISMFYYLIPRMGLGAMISFALSGQLLVAVLCGHFGWFDVPQKPINFPKLMGVAALISGVVLINSEH